MKIVAFTSIRSDYNLMSSLYKLLHDDHDVDLQLVVSGAHLSKTYGYSLNQIQNDGFNILMQIESLIDSDSRSSRVKSASILLQNCIDGIAKYEPDLFLFAGDREDVIIASLVATYLAVPSIHFYSGDHVTDGYVDNPIRHAASKLASAHFVTLEIHKHRLIALGERPDRIFVTGNLALDKFAQFIPLSSDKVEMVLGRKVSFDKSALLIYHPVTEELENANEILTSQIDTLLENGVTVFISYPNTDYGNQIIIDKLESYRSNGSVVLYKNLERDIFLTIYKKVKFIIGNSSSGICEAASIPIPAINVGTRQKGRFSEKNVITCSPERSSIKSAIEKALSKNFIEEIAHMENPYGSGNSSQKAYNLIKSVNFKNFLLKTEDPLENLSYEK